MLGHSMGSFALQQYLLDHSDRVAGAVLTGSSALDVLEPGLDLDDVEVRTYDGARHEVFNETNRDEVLADLVAWLDRVTGD